MASAKLVGKRVRYLRELQNLTQENLEERSGVNFKYISALERGEINATIELLEKLAKGLDVDLLSLFAFGSKTKGLSRSELKKIIDSMPDDQVDKLAVLLRAFFL